MLLVIIGWLVGWLIGWLVGKAVFSETVQRIFLMLWMKLVDYKSRKVTEPDSWFGHTREKVSKLAQNLILWYFSQKRLLQFSLGYCPEVSIKYDLQFEWNLFFREICNFEIFGFEIVKNLPKLRFLAIFSTLHHYTLFFIRIYFVRIFRLKLDKKLRISQE